MLGVDDGGTRQRACVGTTSLFLSSVLSCLSCRLRALSVWGHGHGPPFLHSPPPQTKHPSPRQRLSALSVLPALTPSPRQPLSALSILPALTHHPKKHPPHRQPLSALDLLSINNLVNYFGKTEASDNVEVGGVCGVSPLFGCLWGGVGWDGSLVF